MHQQPGAVAGNPQHRDGLSNVTDANPATMGPSITAAAETVPGVDLCNWICVSFFLFRDSRLSLLLLTVHSLLYRATITSIVRITYIMNILDNQDFTWYEATVCVWS